jgi:hypothetical protein
MTGLNGLQLLNWALGHPCGMALMRANLQLLQQVTT